MKLKDLLKKYGEYEVSDELIAQFKKPSPKTVWDLKEGDDYYVIDSGGNVIAYKWVDYCCDEREVGNIFLTKEEAEQDVERRKVETLLLKHGGRRWFKFSEGNYYIRYQREYGMNIENILYTWVQGVIYFDTREELTKAIEEIGAERILKALFGVR